MTEIYRYTKSETVLMGLALAMNEASASRSPDDIIVALKKADLPGAGWLVPRDVFAVLDRQELTTEH